MKSMNINYTVHNPIEGLASQDMELVERARKACDGSYAPYSGFRVGAAVRLEDGSMHSASNQESEVFPEGMCAERALLYYVGANSAGRKVMAMAIASRPGDKECYPCGACRQVMADIRRRQDAPFRVIMCGDSSATVIEEPLDLLPFTFKL